MESTDPQTSPESKVHADSGDAAVRGTQSPSAPVPTKFQVDLARAMRAAAETARLESVERLAVDSKARVEAIRASSTDAGTELRQRADDDIAEIREWSKGELARIRSETDAKITDRKSWLEHEIQANEDAVQTRVAAVAARVAAFESELDGFFKRLAAESDPTQIAAIAQTLPDVPSLDDEWIEPSETLAVTAAHGEPSAGSAATTPESANGTDSAATLSDSESDESDESDGSDIPEAEESEELSGALAAIGRRLASFGLDSGAAATAEAEAAAGLHLDEAPEPVADSTPDEAAAPSATMVVVDGLISVASIAGFKRNLSRLDGVTGVTVTSGPDGEFIFSVKHDPSAAIEAGLPGMSGFGVRVLESQPGSIKVSAHDPESAGAAFDLAGRRA